MLKYFKNYIHSLKLDEEGFLALGRENVSDRKQGYSMAVLTDTVDKIPDEGSST